MSDYFGFSRDFPCARCGLPVLGLQPSRSYRRGEEWVDEHLNCDRAAAAASFVPPRTVVAPKRDWLAPTPWRLP